MVAAIRTPERSLHLLESSCEFMCAWLFNSHYTAQGRRILDAWRPCVLPNPIPRHSAKLDPGRQRFGESNRRDAVHRIGYLRVQTDAVNGLSKRFPAGEIERIPKKIFPNQRDVRPIHAAPDDRWI